MSTLELRRVGEAVKRHRLERDLGRPALARAAGVSTRTIFNLERGISASWSVLAQVLAELGLELRVGRKHHRRRQIFSADRGRGSASGGFGHPAGFGAWELEEYGDWPDGGGYPHRFLAHAYRALGAEPGQVWHICSGSMQGERTLDIRPETGAAVVADALNMPFADSELEFCLADPPYSKELAQGLYGTGASYPDPRKLVGELARVSSAGAGLLHFYSPAPPHGWTVVHRSGIFVPGQALRAFTVYAPCSQKGPRDDGPERGLA